MSAPPPGTSYHFYFAHTRYSSWSARVDTLLKYYSIPHTSTFVNVQTPAGKSAILSVSPAGYVPILFVTDSSSTSPPPTAQNIRITDSLSISEYLSEAHPTLPLWPPRHLPRLRALARSAAAEMHSSFTSVRSTYDANFLGLYTGPVPVSEKARGEVERILEVWDELRTAAVEELRGGKGDGGFLLGEFGIVDAFFWPVLWRFRTYNLPLNTATPAVLAWMRKMWEDEKLLAISEDYWTQAEDPATAIPKYEGHFGDVPGVEYGRVPRDWKFGGA